MPEIAEADGIISAPVESSSVSQRPPGPGLPESLAWMAGAMLVQIVGSLVGYVAVVAYEFANRGFALSEINHAIKAALSPQSMVILMALGLIFTLIYTCGATMLRLGADGFVRLGFRRPSALQIALIVCLVLPLQLICGELFRTAKFVVPDLGMNQLLEDLKPTSLYTLVLLVAVLPAIWEELLCRGLIGRGLISRWGLIPGILITSVLFGAMHLNPAQSLAVIPLGVALHFVYLTTRSMWGPILLHFLNNAISVVLLKLEDRVSIPGMTEADASQPLPLSMLTVSITVTFAFLLLLWQTRTRFVTDNGDEWDPGYTSLELPPAELGGKAIRESPRGVLLAYCGVVMLGFLGVAYQLSHYGVVASK